MKAKRTSIKSSPRHQISLAGKWQRWLGDSVLDTITVPSSYRPVGVVSLRRSVDLPAVGPHQRAVLRMEGITHQAHVRVNGQEVGLLDPWTPYEFDVTSAIRPGQNDIEVEVHDWQVPLGPSNAWEAYGGIIRDLFLEFRSDPYIENVRLGYDLIPKLDRAECTLDVFLRGTVQSDVELSVRLLRGATTVGQARARCRVESGASQTQLCFSLKRPSLWSPDSPVLYGLEVMLTSPQGQDRFKAATGLRDLRIEGDKFLLNGEQFVIKGVGRHDLWGPQGHTMTDAQVLKDVRMIKAMGANFVRNVHYPHDRRIVQAADRLGLFVSEESGLVWMNFAKCSPQVLEIGFQNLERTIRRDWNSPSLFAIFLANESAPTAEMAKEGYRRVKALVPKMLVSSAHFYEASGDGVAAAKLLYDQCGLDFYTRHPYTYDMPHFAEIAAVMTGKPLVFSEWGGRVIGQSPLIMEPTVEAMGKLVQDGRLAGHCFWGWADLPEFSRLDKEMEGGILKSGVVTEGRVVRPYVYKALRKLFRYAPGPRPEPSRKPRLIPVRYRPLSKSSRFGPISLQGLADEPAQAQAWAEMESLLERYWATYTMAPLHWQETGKRFWLWSLPKFRCGLLPFHTALRDGLTEAIILTPGHPKVQVPIGQRASRLHVLGNVTLPDGYPIAGRFGVQVGRYLVVYQDGQVQEVPMRWGIEAARANMLANASRIDPAASHSFRAVLYVKDAIREIYQARLLSIDTQPKPIDRLECELTVTASPDVSSPAGVEPGKPLPLAEHEMAMAIFAVTAERS